MHHSHMAFQAKGSEKARLLISAVCRVRLISTFRFDTARREKERERFEWLESKEGTEMQEALL